MILVALWLWQYLKFTNALVGIRISYRQAAGQSLTMGTKWQYRLYYEIISPLLQSKFIIHISQYLYHSYITFLNTAVSPTSEVCDITMFFFYR